MSPASDDSTPNDSPSWLSTLEADDPRISADHVRVVAGPDGGDVILVGVVHDHPSSVHRVRSVVETADPDAVALELPALAVPLYRAYAEADRDETHTGEAVTARGGEMSAAIRASDAEAVGIDAPSRRFLRALAGEIRETDADLRDGTRVLRGLARVTRRAIACRLAAPLVRLGLDPDVDEPAEHGCETADAPVVQARDERRQIERSVALLGALDGGTGVALRDAARERAMARALTELREDGAVVAVVGRDHLDPVAERLTTSD